MVITHEYIESFEKLSTCLPSVYAKGKGGVDLSDIDDFSYSAVMRQLRKQLSKKEVMIFLKSYKNNFDNAIKHNVQNPEQIALQKSLHVLNENTPIEFNEELVKNATLSELGEPELVGKYLSNIIKFTLNRISPEKRNKATSKVREKIYNLDVNEIASKKMPASSSMGQSITFVKHVLFNHDSQYVRKVIDNIVKYL